MDMGPLLPLLKSLLPYTRKKLGFNRPPSLFFASDTENASKPLGKTAFYDPAEVSITVFVDGRHPKDILRSISHELVHHMQHERGDFGTDMDTGEGYAQKNSALRELEREAYESGNMCFRDWEDENKQALQEAKRHFSRKTKEMSRKNKRNDAIESILLEKWGFKAKTKEEEIIIELPEKKIAPKKTLSKDFIRNIIREAVDRADRSILSEAPRDPLVEQTADEYFKQMGALGTLVHDWPVIFGPGKLGNVALKQPPPLDPSDPNARRVNSNRPFTPDEMRAAAKVLRDTGNENNRGNTEALAVRQRLLKHMVYSMKLGRKGGTFDVSGGLQSGQQIQLDPAAYNVVFDEFAEEDAITREVVIGSINFQPTESNYLGIDNSKIQRPTRGGSTADTSITINPEWYLRARTGDSGTGEISHVVRTGNDFRIFENAPGELSKEQLGRVEEMKQDRDNLIYFDKENNEKRFNERNTYMISRYKTDAYGNALESEREEGFIFDNAAQKAFDAARRDVSSYRDQAQSRTSNEENQVQSGPQLWETDGSLVMPVFEEVRGADGETIRKPVFDDDGITLVTKRIEEPSKEEIGIAVDLLSLSRRQNYSNALADIEQGGKAREEINRSLGLVKIEPLTLGQVAAQSPFSQPIWQSASDKHEYKETSTGRKFTMGEAAKQRLQTWYNDQPEQFRESTKFDTVVNKFNSVVDARMNDERRFGRELAAEFEEAQRDHGLSSTNAISGTRVGVSDINSFSQVIANPAYLDVVMPEDFSQGSQQRYSGIKKRYNAEVANGDMSTEDFIDMIKVENDTSRNVMDTDELRDIEDINVTSAVKEVTDGFNTDVVLKNEALIRKVVQEALKRKFGE